MMTSTVTHSTFKKVLTVKRLKYHTVLYVGQTSDNLFQRMLKKLFSPNEYYKEIIINKCDPLTQQC